jgi:hypothetical protein
MHEVCDDSQIQMIDQEINNIKLKKKNISEFGDKIVGNQSN